METNRRMSGIVLVFMVLFGLLSSQVVESKSKFTDCYDTEYISCLIRTNKIFKCAFKTLELCLILGMGGHGSKSPERRGGGYTCTEQCAKEKCTHISTRRNPAAWKVESCIGSCEYQCRNS